MFALTSVLFLMRITFVSVAVPALLMTSYSLGNSIQPPVGHTGAAGEQDCSACHKNGPVNPDTGSLTLQGMPDRYWPGQRYGLTVILSYPGMDRAGFQLSARFSDGPDKGGQAGSFTMQDDRAQVVADQTSEIQYVQHSEPGLVLTAPAETSWRFVWQAPVRSNIAVVFNAAVNGANYDDSEFGDAVFLHSWKVEGQRP